MKRFVAEYEHQECTVLLIPTRHDVWRLSAAPAQNKVVELAKLISKYQKVYLGHSCDIALDGINDNIVPFCCQYDDLWMRDIGAIGIVNNGQKQLVKFQFNAWGGGQGLYGSWQKDKLMPEAVGKLLQLPLSESCLTVEGGNLSTNGKGVLLAIKNTIVNDNRNPDLDLTQAEDMIRSSLGIEKFIWFDEGLRYDETGGHVDNLCVFVNDNTVFLSWTDDEHSEQYSVVRSAERILMRSTTAEGDSINIVKIPLPALFEKDQQDCQGIVLSKDSKERVIGEKVQPSYINFVFANNAVIVPQFGDDNDNIAYEIFCRFFAERTVEKINAREIVLGGGGIHCISNNY